MRKIRLLSIFLIIVFFFSNVSILPGSRHFIQFGAEKVYSEGIDSYTKLLMHFDGINGSASFSDVCGKSVTVRGNAQISTSQSKFGGASGAFNGSGDYLSVQDSDDWIFSSEDFTIDTWVKAASFSNDDYPSMLTIIHGNTEGTAGIRTFVLYIDSITRTVGFQCSNDGINWSTTINGTTPIQTNTWYHIAVVRNGNSIRLYLNGLLEISSPIAGAIYAPIAYQSVGIGAYVPTKLNCYFNGYIDELRISKGIARWTSNFTPPSSLYNWMPNINLISPSQNGTFISKNQNERIERINITRKKWHAKKRYRFSSAGD